jgi:arylsulfatase A-like enzyme
MVFSQAVSSGPSTPTSFPGILARIHALDASSEYGLPQTVTTLADAFSQNGYDTAAFHSNPYLNATCGYNKGFRTFFDYESRKTHSKLTTNIREKIRLKFGENSRVNQLFQKFRDSRFGASIAMNLSLKAHPYWDAEEIFSKATEWIQQSESPFFLWLHLMDVHTPYKLRDAYIQPYRQKIPTQKEVFEAGLETASKQAGAISPDSLNLLSDLYDSEVHYVDDQLQQFVEALTRLNLVDSTLLALTADHGEAFCEHGYFGHLNRLNYMTHFLYDEVIRTPLLFHCPNQLKRSLQSHLVSLFDIGPTLLELSGCDLPACWSQTTPLHKMDPSREEKIVFCEGTTLDTAEGQKPLVALRTEKWKYIYNEATQHDELYDLTKDPGEIHNLYHQNHAECNRFKGMIETHLADLSNHQHENDRRPQEESDDQKLIERLKDLGYM